MAAPTQAGFVQFVRNQMGINTTVLPDDSQYLVWAYQVAIAVVNVGLPDPVYMLAVYNRAASGLLNFAQDQTGQTFFADMRKSLGLTSLTTGLVSSTSDNGTSTSLVVPDFVKNMTFGDLQLTKDPYGRQYLILAQELGTNWGLS